MVHIVTAAQVDDMQVGRLGSQRQARNDLLATGAQEDQIHIVERTFGHYRQVTVAHQARHNMVNARTCLNWAAHPLQLHIRVVNKYTHQLLGTQGVTSTDTYLNHRLQAFLAC